jgi:hypothetical protein
LRAPCAADCARPLTAPPPSPLTLLQSKDAFSAQLPRFVALWQQVADSFAAAPPALLFEVLNEPVNVNISQLNQMYAAVLPVMRKNNPTRTVFMGGLSWMSAYWIASNPDAVVFPPLPSGAPDANLALEVHSYDPYAFCLQSPPTQQSWGTPADVAVVQKMYAAVAQWSAAHRGIPVYMGEAGCQVAAPSRAGRLAWYKAVGAASRLISGITIWDDDGSWEIYDRVARTWDTEVLAALFGQ